MGSVFSAPERPQSHHWALQAGQHQWHFLIPCLPSRLCSPGSFLMTMCSLGSLFILPWHWFLLVLVLCILTSKCAASLPALLVYLLILSPRNPLPAGSLLHWWWASLDFSQSRIKPVLSCRWDLLCSRILQCQRTGFFCLFLPFCNIYLCLFKWDYHSSPPFHSH